MNAINCDNLPPVSNSTYNKNSHTVFMLISMFTVCAVTPTSASTSKLVRHSLKKKGTKALSFKVATRLSQVHQRLHLNLCCYI